MQRIAGMAEKEYVCENLGMRQAIPLSSHVIATFAMHLQISQCETLFNGGLPGSSVKRVPRSLFIPFLWNRRTSTKTNKLSVVVSRVNSSMFIAHYLSQTYCSVHLLSQSACFFSAFLLVHSLVRLMIYMRINSRPYSIYVFHSLTFC